MQVTITPLTFYAIQHVAIIPLRQLLPDKGRNKSGVTLKQRLVNWILGFIRTNSPRHQHNLYSEVSLARRLVERGPQNRYLRCLQKWQTTHTEDITKTMLSTSIHTAGPEILGSYKGWRTPSFIAWRRKQTREFCNAFSNYVHAKYPGTGHMTVTILWRCITFYCIFRLYLI
jgi:hypothetical protein